MLNTCTFTPKMMISPDKRAALWQRESCALVFMWWKIQDHSKENKTEKMQSWKFKCLMLSLLCWLVSCRWFTLSWSLLSKPFIGIASFRFQGGEVDNFKNFMFLLCYWVKNTRVTIIWIVLRTSSQLTNPATKSKSLHEEISSSQAIVTYQLITNKVWRQSLTLLERHGNCDTSRPVKQTTRHGAHEFAGRFILLANC